jgi:hypothetical protein
MEAMANPESRPRRLDVSLTQVLAGAVAASCGAWMSSRLGVAGTVLGAALVSTVVTLLSAVYAHGARRAVQAARQRARATYALHQPADRGGTMLLPPVDLEDEHGYRWGRILAVAGALFLVTMAAVTGWEKVSGHPLSCSTCTGTTLAPTRHPAPSTPPSTTVLPTPSSSTPSSSPSPSPSGTPAGSPTATPSPTVSGPSSTPSATGSASQSPPGPSPPSTP